MSQSSSAMVPNKTVLFCGGGTLGPVTPLLAVAKTLQTISPDREQNWITTPAGPENQLLREYSFNPISFSAPKLQRNKLYLLPFVIIQLLIALVNARKLVKQINPGLVVIAGGYVGVPLALIAWWFKIPIIVHQLDLQIGLANQLIIPLASSVTTSWPQTADKLKKNQAKYLGTIVRSDLNAGRAELAQERFGLRPNFPTVLILGGGTGALSINEKILSIASQLLPHCNLLHVVGRGKLVTGLTTLGAGYHAVEYLGAGLADAYAVADLVVSRAGMGTIMELSVLAKPTILVPLAGPQTINATACSIGEAVQLPPLDTAQSLAQTILHLLQDEHQRFKLKTNLHELFIHGGEVALAKIIVDQLR